MVRCVVVKCSFLLIVFSLIDVASGGPSHDLSDKENGIETHLKFIINHPLNKNRPASFLLGSPLTYDKALVILQPAVENLDSEHVEQIIRLYVYTDGINTSIADGLHPNDLWLIPGYYLVSLKEAVDTMLLMKGVSAFWNPSWLPLFSSRAGDFIVFDMNSGCILEIFTKEWMKWEVAKSIEEFVRQVEQNLRSSKIFVGEDGLMDEIIDEEGKLNENYSILDKSGESLNLQVGHIFHTINTVRNVQTRAIFEKNIEEDVQQPNLVFNCRRMPNVCANIRNAINNNGKTRRLQRITSRIQIRRNRRASCGRLRCPRGQSCDEYPFASTSQGGRGATVRCVPAAENNSQGGQLNAFYRRNRLGNGSWFNQRFP